MNSLTCFDKNGWPYCLQVDGIGFIALYDLISIPYFFSRYLKWSFVAWYSKPVLNQTYSILLSLSHFVQISSIISLSDPPDIEQTILSYLLLFIFDHALTKLSPIVWFLGQFSNSPINVFSPNMYLSSRNWSTFTWGKAILYSRMIFVLVGVFLRHYHITFLIIYHQRATINNLVTTFIS